LTARPVLKGLAGKFWGGKRKKTQTRSGPWFKGKGDCKQRKEKWMKTYRGLVWRLGEKKTNRKKRERCRTKLKNVLHLKVLEG